MPDFDKNFLEAKGLPVNYKDWELIRTDRIPVKKDFSGTLRIISTDSEWLQGVNIKVNGKMTILGCEGQRFILWADDVLKDGSVHFSGTSKDSLLFVWNACDIRGNRSANSWQNGAAMIVEVNGNTRRYRCNDFAPDEDFDDLIFEVTIDE